MPPTDGDLTDVYAVDNRFSADAEDEKVEEDVEDGDDNEEVDESKEEESKAYSVKNLDIGMKTRRKERIRGRIRGRFCKGFRH